MVERCATVKRIEEAANTRPSLAVKQAIRPKGVTNERKALMRKTTMPNKTFKGAKEDDKCKISKARPINNSCTF